MAGLTGRVKAAVAALCLAGLALGAVRAAAPDGAERFRAASSAEYDTGGNQALGLALLRDSAADNPRNAFLAESEGRALAAAGDQRGAEAAFLRALELEPFFSGARLGLAAVYGATARGADACRELLLAVRRPEAAPRRDYQRDLLILDKAASERLTKDLCANMKTGGATARGRKTH